jgi:anti-sigma-K factor RskA
VDISCIISSGDVELYVLGLLPADEARKMEQLIQLFPELKEEADRIGETLEAAAMQTAHSPGPMAKERIVQALAGLKQSDDQQKEARPPLRSIPIIEEEEIAGAKVITLKKEKRNYLAAASFIGFLISMGAVVYLIAQNLKNQEKIASLEEQVQTTSRHYTQLKEQAATNEQLVQMMQDKNYTPIQLQNVPGKPDATVQVFWNKQSKEVYLMDVSLPEAPAGKQYQLWAIVDGKPVNAGLLNNRKKHMQKMQDFQKAEAFAVTLEKQGGSPTPTMEEMYVMGKTS